MQPWTKTGERTCKWSYNKILTKLEEGIVINFDPMLQENLPSQLYTLYVQEIDNKFARCLLQLFRNLSTKQRLMKN